MEMTVDETQLREIREKNLGKLLARCLGQFEAEVLSHMEAKGFALEPVFLPVVRNLDGDGSSITELAARAGLSKQTVGPLVRELERRGIVSVSVDPDDRRARIVRFTDLGRAGLLAGLEAILLVTKRYTRTLGAIRMKRLVGSLEDLLAVGQERNSHSPRSKEEHA